MPFPVHLDKASIMVFIIYAIKPNFVMIMLSIKDIYIYIYIYIHTHTIHQIQFFNFRFYYSDLQNKIF